MDPEKQDGVASPEGEGTTPPKDAEGNEPNQPEGSGNEPQGDSTPQDQEGTGNEPQDGQTPPEDNSKRVNDLMSKWQQEEASHNKTREELEALRQENERLKGGGERPQEGKQGEENVPRYRQKGWQPQTMEELQEALIEAEESGYKRATETVQAQARTQEEASQQLDQFIDEVKTADKEFDEEAFYGFAANHKFPVKTVQDLRSVYSAFVDVRNARKEAGQDALKNRENRQEPVHKPGQSGSGDSGPSYNEIRNTDMMDLIHGRSNS